MSCSCFSAKATTANMAEPNPTKHVNYNLGMVLGVDDFTQEFAYLSGRDQWMARDLIGYGTVRGLKVDLDVDAIKGPRIAVESGVAVSPRGQMICVPNAQCAYLQDWVEQHSSELSESSPLEDAVKLYVVLCYRDCATDNVPIAGEPCRSEDQLVAASRLTDDFCLELRLNSPNQREENAVRNFVAWLRQVDVTNSVASSTPLVQFLDAIRAAAAEWLTSPPSSPPGEFMVGSPPGFIQILPEDVCEYMRAAFRVWVTELRPKWIARWHGCAATHFETDDQTEEDCVLLAEVTVPIIPASPGSWTVADSPPVEVDESRRPFIVHLRMLQEWLMCGRCGGGQLMFGSPPDGGISAPMVSGDFVELPDGLPGYQIVAAGIVRTDGTARAPAYNGLELLRRPDGTVALRFGGYQTPNASFQYIVKALVVSQAGAEQAVVTFVSFGAPQIGIILRVANVTPAILTNLELMVEISRYAGPAQ